jgi:hypothetical protein
VRLLLSRRYDSEKRDFVYFFGYRPDPSRPEYIFRRLCLEYAEMVRKKEWDQIEAAIVNSLVIIATGRLALGIAVTSSQSLFFLTSCL